MIPIEMASTLFSEKNIYPGARHYNQAKEEYQIWYYCAVCGKRIDMDPNSDSHKAMIGFMKQNGWGHKSCQGQ